MTHILIIDDEPGICACLSESLELEGYSTEVARNGRQALQAVAQRTPDVILLDLMMSPMSGSEFLERFSMQEARQDASVFLLSAHPAIREEAMRLKADGYFPKPFDLDILCDAIEQAVVKKAERLPS